MAAFRRAYLCEDGRLASDHATAYVVAIAFDLLPDGQARATAGERLAELVRANGFRITTGFIGTPLICDALARTGHLDEPYRLLLQIVLRPRVNEIRIQSIVRTLAAALSAGSGDITLVTADG